jgi:hypothetical protein
MEQACIAYSNQLYTIGVTRYVGYGSRAGVLAAGSMVVMVKMARSMRGRAENRASIEVDNQVVREQGLYGLSHLYMHSRHKYIPHNS